MNLINSDKRNYVNLAYYLVLLLPVSVIFSRFAADFSIVLLSVLFFLIRGENKIFENKLILISFIFIFFSSISSILSNDIFFSLKSSFFHLRFIFFLLTVSILFLYLKKNFLRAFFNVLIACYLILLFDATIQFVFKQNIFGYVVNPITRVSSLFFDELVLGSYLSRLFPLLCFLYIFLKLKINNYFILYFLLHLYFVVFITGERLSFLILNIYYLLFGLFMFKKNLNKLIFIFVTILFFFSIIFYSNSFNPRSSLKNIISQSTLKNYSYCLITRDNIISIPELSEKWNYKPGKIISIAPTLEQEIKSYIPNCDPIGEIFNTKIYYIYSLMHFNHYLSAYEIFKDNKLLGIGAKNFRKICSNKDYYLNEFSCSTHPHNYFIQLLAETGIVGSSLFFLIYISMVYLFICNLFQQNKNNFLPKHILICCFLINFFPILPGGNFFNNWNAILYTLPLGFLLNLYKIKH